MRLATVAATDIVDVMRGRGSENSIFSRNQSSRKGHDHFANLKNRFSLSSSRGVWQKFANSSILLQVI